MALFPPKGRQSPPYVVVFLGILTALAIAWLKLCPQSSIALLLVVILIALFLLSIYVRL
jgi:hypothetical protein